MKQILSREHRMLFARFLAESDLLMHPDGYESDRNVRNHGCPGPTTCKKNGQAPPASGSFAYFFLRLILSSKMFRKLDGMLRRRGLLDPHDPIKNQRRA